MIRTKSTVREIVFLAFIAAMGVAVRLFSIGNFRKPDGGFYFFNPDSYDHLRHIMLGLQQFPAITLYDRFVGFPVGTGHIWAPLYDYVFTAIAYFLGLGKPAIEAICFFSGPILFAVCVFLLFFVARRLFASTPAAMAAALVFTFHPALISYSLPMNFDHHIIEPLFCILFIALPFLVERVGFRPARLIAAASLFVITILFWRGSTIFWLFAFAAVVLRAVAEDNRPLAMTYAKVFALASGMLALNFFFDPLHLRQGVSLVLISWFHPLLLAGCAAALFAIARLSRTVLTRVLLPSLLAGLLLVPFTPLASEFHKFKEAVQFLFGFGDPWLASINELMGTFTTYGFIDGIEYLTVGFILAPLAVITALIQWKRRPDGNTLLLHFAVWCSLLLLAFVYRYAIYSAVIVALTTAQLVAFISLRLDGFRRLAITVLLVMVTITPSLSLSVKAMNATVAPAIRDGLFGSKGALEWIKNNTPVPSHSLTAGTGPEYGILADWDLGSYLYSVAERPALATPFGWETHGFYEHAAFFAAESPEKAMQIVSANRIGYVLSSWNRRMETYHEIAVSGEARKKIPAGTVAPRMSIFDNMYYRLCFQDGAGFLLSDGGYRQALGNYRLLFESEYQGGKVPATGVTQSYYKLFEVVKGATIAGKAAPYRKVLISIALLSGRGRPFKYSDMRQADGRGEYTFHVPYATGTQQGETRAASSYLLLIDGEGPRHVYVSEEQVRQGMTIRF